MTKEEAKKFGLQLLHGIMERNESYPVYANNVKQAIDALSEPSGSSEKPNDLEEAAEISFDEAKSLTEGYMYFLAKGLKENHPRPIGPHWFCEYAKNRFITGAKWQKEQMKRFVEENIGRVSILFADAVASDAIDHEIRKCDFKNGAEWVIGKVIIKED